VQAVISVGEAIAGTMLWSDALAGLPVTAIDDESSGYHMAYSSGSTGRPKGVKLPLSGGPPDAPIAIIDINRRLYGIDADTVYLSPAPLYHTAPLFFSTMVQRLGGEVVVMHEFDAERALAMIERHRVTMTQMVPTMFIRLLKLPATTRERYDLSSLKVVVVSAAPCPAATKKAMIDWLGPIVVEYYSSSEGNGGTFITSDEALRRPGSVGRPFFGRVHICDDEGAEAKTGEIGAVYFEGGLDFAYHNDPEKTREARHPVHSNWTTSGDVGYLDDDGYLFLTDRKAFMIISGGVNIYPQEAENVLATHPKVADVAVFGTPNEEFGEEVKAVVQPADWSDVGPDFEQELIQFCRSHLSAIKCPRSVDFDRALPRHPNGKLYKKGLRDRYLLQPGGGAP
jgi:acyl-CoA synthetase (AMP-forming)/AMP-acid ligase II